MLWKILLVLFFVIANGFFVAAEFSLVKLRTGEIERLAQTGSGAARLLENILQHLDAYLSACQLGITLASLALGWIGEPLIAKMLEPLFHTLGISEDMVHYFAFPIAFVVITSLHITVGEQVPKILAIQKYKPTALAVSMPLVLFYRIFRPLIWALNGSSNAMLRLIGIRLDTKHGETPTEDELRHILFQSTAGGYLKPRERLIMENVMDMEEKIARRYMVPRTQIVYLDRHDTIEEKLLKASESDHTRFPLCEGDLDHIAGIIHVKDIFKVLALKQELTTLIDLAREVLYLPETIRLDALLVEFQKKNAVMAMLVDEYGLVSGMITLENVLEELVGPIQDEFDNERPAIIKKGTDQFEVDATCTVDEVARRCLVELPNNFLADTIGGVVMNALGHIPEVGEKVILGDHEITVLEAEQTKITRLFITKKIPETEKDRELPNE